MMRRINPRGLVPLITLVFVLLATGCSEEKKPTAISPRPDSILQEEWFQDAFAFLSDVHEKLSDPVLRTETRLHLQAGNDAWAWKRLGYERQDLAVLLTRLETLRPGLEMRWPELLEGAPPSSIPDSRAGLVEILRSTEAWPEVALNASKAPSFACAIQIFWEEMSQCWSFSRGDIYRVIGCFYQAYFHFLDNLADGC